LFLNDRSRIAWPGWRAASPPPCAPQSGWARYRRRSIRVARARGLVATSQGLMVVGKVNPDEGVLRAIVDNAFTGLS
jgi:hypothetical protein